MRYKATFELTVRIKMLDSWLSEFDLPGIGGTVQASIAWTTDKEPTTEQVTLMGEALKIAYNKAYEEFECADVKMLSFVQEIYPAVENKE